MAGANSDLEELQNRLFVALLFCARHGWGDWHQLYFAPLALPDDLHRRFWDELRKTPNAGHVPLMTAEAVRRANQGYPALPKSVPADLSLPKLKPAEEKGVQYLLAHPIPIQADLMRAAGKKHASSVQGWPNDRMERLLDAIRRDRVEPLMPPLRLKAIAGQIRSLLEPNDIETKSEFLQIAALIAQHPDVTDEVAENATGIPASIIGRWRGLPKFKALVARQPVPSPEQ